MSIIERDFVLDNGTVKENNYKTKYYVRGEDTKNYRRIGDIPVSGNYELNLPYPLDSRMLVPTEECLTNIEWWRTAFGVDTIIYKGMLVTCIETHKTYVYDGPTIKLTAAKQEDDELEYLPIENWKKQRIDKSLVKWPIDVNDEEIIRIGADIVNPLDEKDDGLYITKNSDLLGAGLYINDKFISIGKNSRRDTNIYPFVPYDMVENFSETISESTFNEAYTNKQMGIYIPTSTDPTVADHQLCIYSANGINLNNTDNSNTIILNSEGNIDISAGDISIFTPNVIDISAGNDINIKLTEDFTVTTENNIFFNAGSNIREVVENEIKIEADTKKEDIRSNINVGTGSSYILTAEADVSINAKDKLNLQYGNSAKIFSADSNGLIDISTRISIKAPNDISINSDDSSIILTAKNGNVNIDSEQYINNTTNNFKVNTPDLLFNIGSGNKYAKISANTATDSLLSLETQFEAGSTANISLNNNNININAVGGIGIMSDTVDIKGKINIKSKDDKKVLSADDTSISISTQDKPVKINGITLPIPQAEDKENECILRLTKFGQLKWSKDIGVKHCSTIGGASGYAPLVKILNTNIDAGIGYETVILAVSLSWSDASDISEKMPATQLYEIKILFNSTKSDEKIWALVQCLSGIPENVQNAQVKDNIIITRRSSDRYDLDIWVYVHCHDLSWNILTYSDNCTILETLDPVNDLKTYSLVLPNDDANNEDVNIPITWDGIVPIFNAKGANGWIANLGRDKGFIIPPPNNIARGKSGFLKYTRVGNPAEDDIYGSLEWGNSENLIKSFANNDTDTKVFIVGTEKSSASGTSEGISFHEFYNDSNVYIDQYCNIFATAFYATSDERKKKDIKEIEFNDASILIPKEYKFKESNKKAYGFIAQEVEKAGYTDIVNTDKDTGDKTLDYNSAFAIAIALMQARIKQLEDEIKELKNK